MDVFLLWYYLTQFSCDMHTVGKVLLPPVFCHVVQHILYSRLRINESLCFMVSDT